MRNSQFKSMYDTIKMKVQLECLVPVFKVYLMSLLIARFVLRNSSFETISE
jgi:hypothetical protein